MPEQELPFHLHLRLNHCVGQVKLSLSHLDNFFDESGTNLVLKLPDPVSVPTLAIFL